MNRTRTLVAIASFAALGLLAACGNDDSSKPADTTTAAAPETTTGSSDGTTADTAGGTDATPADGPGAGTEFCNYQDELNSMDTPFEDANATAADYQQFFEETVAQAVDQMRSTAPDEIKADVETLAKGLEKVSAAFAKVGYDPTKAQQDPDVVALFSDQAYNDAGAKVDAYCGYGS